MRLAIAKSRVAAAEGLTICVTRYGNVMASRGSVIPLFAEQIRNGVPITVTDARMTRFMMTVEEAVELVLYAFDHGDPGDLFVQKAPAATLETLVAALLKLYDAEVPVRTIGSRHGEKLYETLLTREELAKAEDLGGYYRIKADVRDLNYNKYFTEGEEKVSHMEDYNSHNTRRLNVGEVKEMLLKLDYIRLELGSFRSP